MVGSFNQTANLQLQVDKRSLAQVERQISRAVGDASKINFGIKPGAKSSLGSIGRDINEFRGALDAANKRVIAFGASVAVIEGVRQGFVELVKTTVEVEKRLADINNILNLSSKSLESFSKALFDTARNTGQSLQTAADAAVELSRQGLGAEETVRRLNDALILSRLSGLDAAKSVEALTATINSFNKQLLTSTEIVNKFAELDARFAVSSADLAEGLQRVGSSAQEAGVSLEEVSALITSVQQTTARGGAVIGNAFKSIFTRIVRSDVQQVLNDIGVATQNADGSFRNQALVLQDLAKVYRTLPDSQRAFIAETVAGVYQSNIFKATINDLGNSFSIYSQALDTASKATDGAIKRNEDLNKALSATANQALLNLQQIAATIGNIAIAPNLKGVLDFFNQIAGEINNVDTQSIGAKLGKGIISGIGEFVGGPGAVLLFAAVTSVFTRIAKLASGSLKDLLGMNNQFKQTTFLQQQAVQFLQQQPQILAQIRQGTMSIADAQRTYVQYLREAQILQNNIVAGTLARGLSPSLERVAAKKTTRDQQQRGYASGYMPSEKEMIQNRAYGTPSTAIVKKGNVAGLGQVEYNSSERIIRDFPIKGKDSVLPTDPKRASETFKRFGFAAAGYVPNFANRIGDDQNYLRYSHDPHVNAFMVDYIRTNKRGMSSSLYEKLFAKAKGSGVSSIMGLLNPQRSAVPRNSGDPVSVLKSMFPQLIRGRYGRESLLSGTHSSVPIKLRGGKFFDEDLRKHAPRLLEEAQGTSLDYTTRLASGYVPNFAKLIDAQTGTIEDLADYIPLSQRRQPKTLGQHLGSSVTSFLDNLEYNLFSKMKDNKFGLLDPSNYSLSNSSIFSSGIGLGKKTKLKRRNMSTSPLFGKNSPFGIGGKKSALGMFDPKNYSLKNSSIFSKFFSPAAQAAPLAMKGKYNPSIVANELVAQAQLVNSIKDPKLQKQKLIALNKRFATLQSKDYDTAKIVAKALSGKGFGVSNYDGLASGYVPNFAPELLGRGAYGSFYKLRGDIGKKQFHGGYSPNDVEEEYIYSKLTEDLARNNSVFDAPAVYGTRSRSIARGRVGKKIVNGITTDKLKNMPMAYNIENLVSQELLDNGITPHDLHLQNLMVPNKLATILNNRRFGRLYSKTSDKDTLLKRVFAKNGKPSVIDPGLFSINSGALANRYNQYKTSAASGFVPNFANPKEILIKHLQEMGVAPGTQLPIKQRNILQVGYFKKLQKAGLFQPTQAKALGSFFSKYIPNFALDNPVQSAVEREMAAGVPKSRIRVGFDSRVGLGVYNTKDEPAGLKQGVNRELRRGRNPKMAGSYIPNFADEDSYYDPQAGALGFGGIGGLLFAMTAFQRSSEDVENTLKQSAKINLKEAKNNLNAIKREKELNRQRIEVAKSAKKESAILKEQAFERNQAAQFYRSKAKDEVKIDQAAERAKRNLGQAARARERAEKSGELNLKPFYDKEQEARNNAAQALKAKRLNDKNIKLAFQEEQQAKDLQQKSLMKQAEARTAALSTQNIKTLNTKVANAESLVASARTDLKTALKANSPLSKFGGKLGSSGLGLSLVAPVIGGIAASGFDRETKKGRVGSTATQALGNTLGFAGAGATLGMNFGPYGALAGAGIGAAAGIGLGITDVINELNRTYPELQKSLEKNVEKFSKLQDGAQKYLEIINKQASFLENGDRSNFAKSQIEIAKIIKDFSPEIQKQLSSLDFTDLQKAQRILADEINKKANELGAQQFATDLVTRAENERENGFGRLVKQIGAIGGAGEKTTFKPIATLDDLIGRYKSLPQDISNLYNNRKQRFQEASSDSIFKGKNAQLQANVAAQDFSSLAITAIQRISGPNADQQRKDALDKLRVLVKDGTNSQEIAKFVQELPGFDDVTNSAFKLYFEQASTALIGNDGNKMLDKPLREILESVFNSIDVQNLTDNPKIFEQIESINKRFSKKLVDQEIGLSRQLFDLDRNTSQKSFITEALTSAGLNVGSSKERSLRLSSIENDRQSQTLSSGENLNQLRLELEKQIALANVNLSISPEEQKAIDLAQQNIAEESQRVAERLEQINTKFKDEIEKIQIAKLVNDFLSKDLSQSLGAQKNVVQSGRGLRDIDRQIKMAQFTASTGRQPNEFEQNQALYGNAFISSSEVAKREANEQLEILNFDRQIQKIEYENAIKQALILKAEEDEVSINEVGSPMMSKIIDFINQNPQTYSGYIADKERGLASYETASEALKNPQFISDFLTKGKGGKLPSFITNAEQNASYTALPKEVQSGIKSISLYSENLNDVISSYDELITRDRELIKLRDISAQQLGTNSQEYGFFNKAVKDNKVEIEKSAEAYKFATKNYEEYVNALYEVTPQKIAAAQRSRIENLAATRGQSNLALQSGATGDEIRNAFANQADAAFAGKNYAEFFGRTLDAQLYTTWEDGIKKIADITVSTFQNIETGLTEALTGIINGTTSAEDAFKSFAISLAQDIQKQAIQGLIKQALGGIQSALASAGGGQGGSGGIANILGSVFGGKAKGGLIQKFASGGMVTGGSGVRDDVPAMLNSGEYVLKRSAVNKYGADFIHALNSGHIGKFAIGGPTDKEYGTLATGKASSSGFSTGFDLNNKFDLSGENKLPIGVGLSEYALTQSKLGQEAIQARGEYLQSIAEYEAELKKFKAQYSGKNLGISIGTVLAGIAVSAGGSKIGQMGSGGSQYYSTSGNLVRNGSMSVARNSRLGSIGFAAGGMAKGTDRVPAMLTGGEFVVNRDSVSRYGLPFMNSLNRGTIDPLKVQYRADGGVIGTANTPAGKASGGASGNTIQNNNQISISITSAGNGQIETSVEGKSTFEGGKDKENSEISDRERIELQKALSMQIKGAVLDVIEKESRPNGRLSQIGRR